MRKSTDLRPQTCRPQLCAPANLYTVTKVRKPGSVTTATRLRTRLIRQQHFVVIRLSSLVVAGSGAVLVGAAPLGPGPDDGAGGDGRDQVCQETADLAERDRDEAAARAFGAVAAVTAR